MGARPSSFKKGGGYLNEVDVEIIGYTFEVGDEALVKKGPRKGETFTPLSLVPEFKVDGDDEPKTQRLLIGNADAYGDIEDDGHTLLTPDGQAIGAKSEAGLFIASLCDGGFDETLFDDDDTRINFEPMIGTRCRLVQQTNEEKTKRQGRQKGKDGKEYDRKDLLVQTVHAAPDAKSAGKTTSKGASKSAKPSAKPGKAKAVDVAELAAETLRAICGEQKDNTIAKSKLSMAVLKKLMKDENREAVREWLFDDDNLAGLDGFTFNPKKQTITLDEA